jgi:hypothetical protein
MIRSVVNKLLKAKKSREKFHIKLEKGVNEKFQEHNNV